MKLTSYFSELAGARRLALLLALSNVLLALAALVFVFSYTSREVVTRIVPVGMTTTAEIGARSANADYKRAIALFIATMSSSLQPATAPSVVDDLSAFFDPAVFRAFREQALQIVNDPIYRQAGVVSVFVPSSVMYEAATDRVFVIGSHMLRGAGINRSTSLVYEMSIGISRGRPVVTFIKAYQGTVPDTLKTLLSRHKGKLDMLPEYALPLKYRGITPDEVAEQVINERGDIDSVPSLPNASAPAAN